MDSKNYDNMIEWKSELAFSLTHRQSLYSSSFSPDFFILLKSLFLDDNTVNKEWKSWVKVNQNIQQIVDRPFLTKRGSAINLAVTGFFFRGDSLSVSGEATIRRYSEHMILRSKLITCSEHRTSYNNC